MGRGHRSYELLENGDLVLVLTDHCIQTTAKQAHAQMVAAILEGEAPVSPLEGPLELVVRFLKEADFAKLRAQHPQLAGGAPCRVHLVSCGDDPVAWELCQPA